MIVPSDIESRRFDLTVGRAAVDENSIDDVVTGLDQFDVVIVRSAAECRYAVQRLAAAPRHHLVPADHLMYWGCRTDAASGPPASLPEGWTIRPAIDVRDVVAVVRASFDHYGSHYSANPLFNPSDVLDGYCEWAADLHASDMVWSYSMYDEFYRPVGVALTDHSGPDPDIRLAGMIPDAQGRGCYAALIQAVNRMASSSGFSGLLISTQSTNIRVMRAWARMGFLPVSTTMTNHMIRGELLDAETPKPSWR
jgi:GNAT superfamily N-acetyltransferase